MHVGLLSGVQQPGLDWSVHPVYPRLNRANLKEKEMAYVEPNFQTKKALKEAVKAGQRVTVYQPGGIFPLTVHDGRCAVEGPHSPQPHRWYAEVEVDDTNAVIRVVS